MVKEEIIDEEIDNINNKSRATKIRILLKKNERLFKDKQAIVEFKEPIAMLMRRSRAVEFFEDASKGKFVFTHSDGKPREIYLDPSFLLSFDYGKRKFKGYWLHEDFPLPLPENPLIYAENINMIVEKSMMDANKLDLKNKELSIKRWKMIIIGIAVLAGLYMAYQAHWADKLIGMVTGNKYVEPVQQTVKNVSNAIAVQGIILFGWIGRKFNGRK